MELGRQVYSKTYDLLADIETLEGINEERKRASRQRKHEDHDPIRMNSVLDGNPHLARFFGTLGQMERTGNQNAPGETRCGTTTGGRITGGPQGPRPLTEDYTDQKEIPDQLIALERVKRSGEVVEWDGEGPVVKEVSSDGYGFIKLKLNAVDDYFRREAKAGAYCSTLEELDAKHEFASGVLRIKVRPFENALPRNEIPFTIRVARPGSDDLTETIVVRCVESSEPSKGEEPDPTEPGDESVISAVGQPNITPVERSEWLEHGFTEETIVEIEGEDPREFEYLVNVDAEPIADFRERRSIHDEGTKIVNEEWSAAVFLTALGSYMRWARAIHRRMVELDGTEFLDDELLPDENEEEEREDNEEEALLPSESHTEQVIGQFDSQTLDALDVNSLAAASVSGACQALMDWRYGDEGSLEGLSDDE
jgi:hypothetical protein